MNKKQKTIYIYQYHLCQIGGVETFYIIDVNS